jgi:hypothetical protein
VYDDVQLEAIADTFSIAATVLQKIRLPPGLHAVRQASQDHFGPTESRIDPDHDLLVDHHEDWLVVRLQPHRSPTRRRARFLPAEKRFREARIP